METDARQPFCRRQQTPLPPNINPRPPHPQMSRTHLISPILPISTTDPLLPQTMISVLTRHPIQSVKTTARLPCVGLPRIRFARLQAASPPCTSAKTVLHLDTVGVYTRGTSLTPAFCLNMRVLMRREGWESAVAYLVARLRPKVLSHSVKLAIPRFSTCHR